MFIHFRGHSTFSMLEAIWKIKDILNKIEEHKMTAIALTEYYFSSWFAEFYQKAKKKNIKPIIWIELWFVFDVNSISTQKNISNITLIAKNLDWYFNLLKIISEANKYKKDWKPNVDFSLLQQYNNWIIILLWWEKSILWQMINFNEKYKKISDLIEEFIKIFGKENVILDLIAQDYKIIPQLKKINDIIQTLAWELNLLLLVNNNFHYINKEDKTYFETALAIKDWKKIYDQDRRKVIWDYHIMNEEEILNIMINNWYKENFIKKLFENSQNLAQKINVEIPLHQKLFPNYKTPDKIKNLYDKIKDKLVISKKMSDLAFFVWLVLLFLSLGINNFAFAWSIVSWWIEIVDNSVFKVPLDKYDIKVFIWNPTISVKNWVRKFWWEWGINWWFFCPAESSYKRCWADNSTSSDRISEWKVYSKYPNDTWMRWILWFDKNWKVLFVQKNLWYVGSYLRNTNANKLKDIYNWIGNRPILLDQGYNPLDAYWDMINYPKNLKKMTRNFICSTKDWKTIYMWFVPNKTIYEMPEYLKQKYWCRFAINLDAWKSSAMIFHDKYIIWPWRDVVDWYVIVPKQRRLDYELKNYKPTDKDMKVILFLFDLLEKKIKFWWGKQLQQKIIKVLDFIDKKPQIRWNIPLRVRFRILKDMIASLNIN